MDNNVYQSPESDLSTRDDDATQPVKLFNASGRMGRVRYIAYTVGLPMLMLLPVFIIGFVMGLTGKGDSGSIGDGILFLILGVIFYTVVIAAAIWATIQRCHDFDTSGWLTLLLIVPLVPWIFWFIPGTKGENRFGPKPEPNKPIHWIGATVAPVLMIVGVLAAIAIPAYQDYVERAKQAQIQSYNQE